MEHKTAFNCRHDSQRFLDSPFERKTLTIDLPGTRKDGINIMDILKNEQKLEEHTMKVTYTLPDTEREAKGQKAYTGELIKLERRPSFHGLAHECYLLSLRQTDGAIVSFENAWPQNISFSGGKFVLDE